ncbi:MAG: hypothetical protein SWK90_19675 [Chloroflexota bacterium]|nr:hypothetical protein [Chloroflexota bacterium]
MAAGRKIVLPAGAPEPQTLGDVVNDLDRRMWEGRLEDYLPIPTGFTLLPIPGTSPHLVARYLTGVGNVADILFADQV